MVKSSGAKFCIAIFIKDHMFLYMMVSYVLLYTDTMIDHELSTFVHLKDIHPINKTLCHIHIICHFSKIEMLF